MNEEKPTAGSPQRSGSAVLSAAGLQHLATTQDALSPMVTNVLHPEDTLEDMEEDVPDQSRPMDHESETKLRDFRLSFVLANHDSAVRDIASVGDDMLVSAEERGKMHVYAREGVGTSFLRRDTLHEKVHQGTLTFVVQPVPPQVTGYPDDTFVSGGNDNTARLWTGMGSLVGELPGHTDCVNSISFSSQGHILTGCWDGVARAYAGGVCVQRLTGHANAVEVLGLETGEIVCASTNGNIQLYDPNFAPLRTVVKAHDHAVRKLVTHPLGFASCGNDGFIKIWSTSGENLLSIPAHVGGKKYDAFVYGLGVTSNGGLVSCGEDQTVKVWRPDGGLMQTIRHPGPVRALCVLPNGDIVTACADRSVRVFTQESKRMASSEVQSQFDSLVNMAMASNMSDIDVEALPGEEALLQPGNQDGAIKVVRVGTKAMVYKWDAVKQLWDVFGEALGASNRTIVDGKEYEVVTEVFVTDKISHKLAFNKDEDPQVIADRFLASHSLPAYLRDQIVEHVTPLVDMDRVRRSKELAKKLREEKALQQIPSWISGGYELFAASKADAMRKKLLQFNAQLSEGDAKLAMTKDDLVTFERLMDTVKDPQKYHTAPFSDEEARLMVKLLHWPPDRALPVLDCYRVLMVHQDAVRKIPPTDGSISSLLFHHVDSAPSDKVETTQSLVLKALANFVGKRIKTSQERQSPPVIPGLVNTLLSTALDRFAGAATSSKDALVHAYIVFVHNITTWLGKLQVSDSDHYMVVASALFEILDSATTLKPRTLFHALLTLGSIAVASQATKEMIQEAFGEQLQALVAQFGGSPVPAVCQVASDLKKVFLTVH